MHSSVKKKRIAQVNLQENFGGGETYTISCVKIFKELGVENSILITSSKALYWQRIKEPDTKIFPIQKHVDIVNLCLKHSIEILVVHSGMPIEIVKSLRRHAIKVIVVIHMPQFGRAVAHLKHYSAIVAVSFYVIESLKSSELTNIIKNPTYAIAELDKAIEINNIPTLSSIYAWDQRKYRDRLGKITEPLWRPISHYLQAKKIKNRKRIQLGIVSRITPIKQFPLLFKFLAPILAEYDDIGLDIYGAGGYRSIQDLKTALSPIADKVRWFGFQTNPFIAYKEIDYLVLGLPEKEALGINVLEAGAQNLPALAIDALPFTETIEDGKTGLLYKDPRIDQGQDFRRVIESIQHQKFVAQVDEIWLQKFSEAAFTERWKNILAITQKSS